MNDPAANTNTQEPVEEIRTGEGKTDAPLHQLKATVGGLISRVDEHEARLSSIERNVMLTALALGLIAVLLRTVEKAAVKAAVEELSR